MSESSDSTRTGRAVQSSNSANQLQVNAAESSSPRELAELSSNRKKDNIQLVKTLVAKETTTEITNIFKDVLSATQLNSSYNLLITSQNKRLEAAAARDAEAANQTVWKCFIDGTSREVQVLIFGIAGLLIYFLAQDIFVLAVIMGFIVFCYGLTRLLSYLESQNKVDARTGTEQLTMQLIGNESKNSKETALILMDKANAMQEGINSTVLKITEIHGATHEMEVNAIKDMHKTNCEAKVQLQQIQETGQNERAVINKNKEENLANISAETTKFTTKLKSDTNIQLGGLKLQGKALKEETIRIRSKNDKVTAEKVAQINDEQHKREIYYKTEVEKDRLAQDHSVKLATVKSDADKHRVETEANKVIKLQEFEVTKHESTEITNRERIRRRGRFWWW